jgi:PAS domain S-box-containing protein
LDVLETMSDAFYTLDRDTRFTLVNAEAELLMGRSRSEMLGRTLSEAFPAGNGHPLRAAQLRALREQITVVEEAHYAPSGRWLSIRCYPSPEGLAVYFQDVTHHKRLEAQLRRSQKLEAVGQLVSGVAHDFNNLLTVIEGYSTLARQRLDAEEPFVTRALGEIQRASASASALTAKLLAFGRADEPDTTISDITTIVTGALNLVAPLIGEDIIVHRDLDSQPHHAVVDTALIEQVIVNLAVNARDAMPGGGNLWVSTGSLELDPDPAHALAAGRYVFVRVRDDGAGIDADTLAQVFDPFFTTKPTGMGTGLGLATASLTVSKAGGRLDVTSSPGQGASFTVWLPEIDAGDGLRGSEPVEPGGLILLVDDEAPLRNLFARSLRADGYVVVEASGPAEALAACAEQVFDLLITDGLLPDGGGAALAAAAVARHPDLAILHISGAGADAFPRSDATIRVDFLAKPFTVEQLAESARRLLHRRSAT